jgi:hypothetical protein
MDKYKVCQDKMRKDIYKKFHTKRGSFGKDGVFKILENHKLILNID